MNIIGLEFAIALLVSALLISGCVCGTAKEQFLLRDIVKMILIDPTFLALNDSDQVNVVMTIYSIMERRYHKMAVQAHTLNK